LGRRQSIERTTARRCPSARKRSEAESHLPTPASGRPRDPDRSGGRVTRPGGRGRRSREVYRVYTEDEYLSDAGSALALVDAWPALAEPARRDAGGRRSHRVAGVAMLTGTVGMVGVAVIVSGSWHPGAARGPGTMIAAARLWARSGVVRSPAITASYAAPSGPVVTGLASATRARVSQAGWRGQAWRGGQARRRGGLGLSPPRRSLAQLPAHRSIQPRRGVAIVGDYSPAPASRTVTAAGAPAGAGTTTATTTVASTVPSGASTTGPPAQATAAGARPAPGIRAEFGFER
jgi:hypothetical protein